MSVSDPKRLIDGFLTQSSNSFYQREREKLFRERRAFVRDGAWSFVRLLDDKLKALADLWQQTLADS